MHTRAIKLTGIVAVALVLAACQAQPYRDDPPHHAGPYGDRWHPYDYYYYPSVQVYFQIHSGYYWYHERGRWYRTYHLPPYLVLPRERRHIRIDGGEPWRHHDQHRQRYPARQRPAEPIHQRERVYDRNEREQHRSLYRESRDRDGDGRRQRASDDADHSQQRRADRGDGRHGERRQDRREDRRGDRREDRRDGRHDEKGDRRRPDRD